jgi:hypothetical protein
MFTKTNSLALIKQRRALSAQEKLSSPKLRRRDLFGHGANNLINIRPGQTVLM